MWSVLRLCHVGILSAGLTTAFAEAASANSALTAQGLTAFSGGRYAQAAHDWQRAVATGDGQAALYMGLMHDLGRGVARDVQTARAWYERGAALGNPVAMFNLAVLCDSGVGVPRDRAVSIAWYRKAAALGMGRAAYALGLIYKAGDGVPPDRTQALIYFRQALANGVTAARPHLASLGEPGGEARRDKAAAGDRGNDQGLAAFERAQDLLLERTPQALREAAALLRQAADKGDLLAAYDLAYCYDQGLGVQVDKQRAYVWYARAAQSATATVQRAARAGMLGVASTLSPTELTAAKSAAGIVGAGP